jgi:PIN domain nuclease of toxin-antitoxin system
MVALELQNLHETGRITVEPGLVLENGYTNLGLSMDGPGAGPAIVWARNFTWTRDPFDRIITAQASLNGALLLTKDATIRQNYDRAVWD